MREEKAAESSAEQPKVTFASVRTVAGKVRAKMPTIAAPVQASAVAVGSRGAFRHRDGCICSCRVVGHCNGLLNVVYVYRSEECNGYIPPFEFAQVEAAPEEGGRA